MPAGTSSATPALELETVVERCISTSSLRRARQLHALILTSGLARLHSPFIHNNVLSMYSICGSLQDAQKVLDSTPQRNVVTFNSLIAAYSHSPPHSHLAFKIFSRMRKELLAPIASTSTGLLHACSSMNNSFLGKMLHSQLVQTGLLSNILVQTSLRGMYSHCGLLESAIQLFKFSGHNDTISWNSMMAGCLKNGKASESLQLFSSMLRSEDKPDRFSYSIVLSACSKLKERTWGKIIHAKVITSNVVADIPLQNAMVDMYCSCDDIVKASTVFRGIINPDMVSFNSIMLGFAEHGDAESSMKMFNRLRNLYSMKPDEYGYAAVISASSSQGSSLHALVQKEGFSSSIFVASVLISFYFQREDANAAMKIFSGIYHKDAVIWTEMITGCNKIGEGEQAMEFFKLMILEGHRIDSFSLSVVTNACADLAMLKTGEMIHSQAVKTGFHGYMSVMGSMVDMYAKSGNIKAAELIFSAVAEPDLMCWNSMIGGYSHHGMAERALHLFDIISELGILPDRVTFISLLSACSHSGLVLLGKSLWASMAEYGISPDPKLYSCMVSLLSRAGLLEEAEELIMVSPFCGEYLHLWRTLLSYSASNGNIKIGRKAAERVLLFAEEDSATHILLSNLYAADQRWEGVAQMRRRMRDIMAEKEPGLSWIQVMSKIYVFSSGERTLSGGDEIEEHLEILMANMVQLESNIDVGKHDVYV